MEDLSITLPGSLREFVASEVTAGHYHSPSAYLEALVREAQRRKAKEKVDALLVAGLESGPASPLSDDDWQQIRRELQERQARRLVK